MRITIKTDNAAFSDPNYEDRDTYDDPSDAERADAAHDRAMREEVARILKTVAEDIDNGGDCGSCIDANGNTVGTWSL